MKVITVEGTDKRHKILLYTLSTCAHCKATKQFFRENDVEFEYLDVDLCDQQNLQEIKNDILKRKSNFAFPKIIIDDQIFITGFDKDKITKALKI